MRTPIFIILILILLLSCRQELPERLYKTPDEVTGGFETFVLNLKSNGNLELQMKSTKTITTTDTGNLVETPIKIITGKWQLENERILYTFDETKSSIDSFFLTTDFPKKFIGKDPLTFSKKLDTAFIYGLPSNLIAKKCNFD